jgi:hypothetical protein
MILGRFRMVLRKWRHRAENVLAPLARSPYGESRAEHLTVLLTN